MLCNNCTASTLQIEDWTINVSARSLQLSEQSVPTCSHVDIPGLDPAELVLRNAAVGLRVNLLLVVAGAEGGQDQVSVVHNLQYPVVESLGFV